MTLLETIGNTEFSPEAVEMFASLVDTSTTDETALVILAAAAAILAFNAVDEDALLVTCCEFSEVAEDLRLHFSTDRSRPTLMVVAGTDHTPIQKEA